MESSDEQLVARVAATRDTEAFEELVHRHQAALRGWLRQLARDPAEADDLAQETFIRVWDRAASFGGRGSFKGWLMKIAYNYFLQARRKEGRHRRLAAVLDNETPAPSERDAGVHDLPKLLSVLSDDERAAMTLCYAHGFSHGEIAKITELPLGTVKSHIRRGKTKIRERFSLVTEDD